jgi:S-adenosylmethionine:tRNA ribosyltransferase-isomerase
MEDIDINEYNYYLPEGKIAQHPLKERDMAKLLIYKDGQISTDIFKSVHKYLPSDSLLVFNNTKVIRARLYFRKDSGAAIEILCLEPVEPSDYAQSFSSKGDVEWKCIVGNLKKWKSGLIKLVFRRGKESHELFATKIYQKGDACRIRFSWSCAEMTFGEVIESAGSVPLPPYLDRQVEPEDCDRYQTIYSMIKGSVAAPTAGLHFTQKVLSSIISARIETVELTLHVGAGTFQPVKGKNALNHEMHSERFFIEAASLERIAYKTGKLIAVGTTSVRTLESIYWLGIKLLSKPETASEDLWLDQWEPYDLNGSLSRYESIEIVLEWMRKRKLDSVEAPTRIMIVPGYKFRMTDGIITNFHLPKSTLLLLISAWVGSEWKRIYDYALTNDFRFLSYGDSSLLMRK